MSLFSKNRVFVSRKAVAQSHGAQVEGHEVGEFVSAGNKVCPCCGGHKDKLELLCYYSNEGILWSDYRHVLPQVAVPSLVQKCPHCGKHYIVKAGHVLIKDTADFEFIDPVSWNYFSKSYEDYSVMKKDDVVDYNHRLRILGAFNEEFRRTKNPPVPTEQDIKIYRDNMLHLMGYFQDPLDRAEMYREMGLFEECFKQLDMVEDEGDEMKMKYKDTVFDLARQEKVSPFAWKAE